MDINQYISHARNIYEHEGKLENHVKRGIKILIKVGFDFHCSKKNIIYFSILFFIFIPYSNILIKS